MKKRIFDQLNWLNDEGPFVTLTSPSTFVVSDMTQDRLHFKNLMRSSKDMFVEKYPDLDYEMYENALQSFYEDRTLWQGGAHSFIFVVNRNHAKVLKLGIDLEPQVYVDDVPYIIPLIEDVQFLGHFYLLGLNRDSFRIYEISGHEIKEVVLPDDAPTTLEKALGDDLSTSGVAHGSGRGSQSYYGGVGTTRDERAVDRTNYFYVVDRFLNDFEDLDSSLPIELMTLPENRSVYLELSKLINLDRNMGILVSPSDFNSKKILDEALDAMHNKTNRTVESLFDMLDRYKAAGRVNSDKTLLKDQAQFGAVHSLLVSKERLDIHDYETNKIVIDILNAGGDVFILNADRRLGADRMTALLRFKV